MDARSASSCCVWLANLFSPHYADQVAPQYLCENNSREHTEQSPIFSHCILYTTQSLLRLQPLRRRAEAIRVFRTAYSMDDLVTAGSSGRAAAIEPFQFIALSPWTAWMTSCKVMAIRSGHFFFGPLIAPPRSKLKMNLEGSPL